MALALVDYHASLLSTQCTCEDGMNVSMYTPSFTGLLDGLDKKCAMRVLTEQNITTYQEMKILLPSPFLGPNESRETYHLPSCIRCTYHSSRKKLFEELVACSLLEPEFLKLHRDGLVPGVMSYCKLPDARPEVAFN